MIDFFKEFRLYLSDKLSNPLAATFVASWCLWNFEKIIVVLSSESALVKLTMIDGMYSRFYFNEMIAPFLSSVLIIIWPYPAISKRFYTKHREHKNELKNEAIRLDKLTPVDNVEYTKLYEKALLQESKYENDLSLKTGEIEKLKKILELKSEEIEEYKKNKSSYNNSKNIVDNSSLNVTPVISSIINYKDNVKNMSDLVLEFNDEELEILNLFKKHDKNSLSSDKFNHLAMSNIEKDFILNNLIQKNILQQYGGNYGAEGGYKLSLEGQKKVLSL